MCSEFVIRKGPKQWEANIFSGKDEIAKISREGLIYKLVRQKDGLEWVLTNKVQGELRPFSFTVRKSGQKNHGPGGNGEKPGQEVFAVRDQIFQHNGKFYMIANHPEDKTWNEHVYGSVKYIGRLDDFPYSDLSQVDHDHYTLRDKIKRLRGKSVGEASGVGTDKQGHRVKLDSELDEVGLFIAVISYLLYAAA